MKNSRVLVLEFFILMNIYIQIKDVMMKNKHFPILYVAHVESPDKDYIVKLVKLFGITIYRKYYCVLHFMKNHSINIKQSS